MTKGLQGGGVDAGGYHIVYDNSWEHLEIDELDLPVNGEPSPIIKWIHEFQSVVEQAGHRSRGRND